MAADESMPSPISTFQMSLSVAGGTLEATPVRRALPRNWGQSEAGACASGFEDSANSAITTVNRRARGDRRVIPGRFSAIFAASALNVVDTIYFTASEYS